MAGRVKTSAKERAKNLRRSSERVIMQMASRNNTCEFSEVSRTDSRRYTVGFHISPGFGRVASYIIFKKGTVSKNHVRAIKKALESVCSCEQQRRD